jgi:hypothetical protein
MDVAKAAVRVLIALFAAFFGTVQLSMTFCPALSWTQQLCHTHRIASPILSFALLFALTLLVLSRRYVGLRLPLAVVLLLSYGIHGVMDAIGYQLWWFALVPVVALAAAVGVGMRARWGTLLTYAISILFVLYWSWGIVTAARTGFFGSRPALEAALSFVPGTAFALLAGFCCYTASGARAALPPA